jgi:sulfate transport system permease protein
MRAIGQFGAVSVTSGHVRGETDTIPLQMEILYNEYNFAVRSLLHRCWHRWRPGAGHAGAQKTFIEWRLHDESAEQIQEQEA